MEMLDGKTAASEGFDAGNYANAYESEDLQEALEYNGLADRANDDTYRAAFILGFFGSYTLAEIPESHRDDFDEAYWSPVGHAVLAAGYCDDRADEYQEEQEQVG